LTVGRVSGPAGKSEQPTKSPSLLYLQTLDAAGLFNERLPSQQKDAHLRGSALKAMPYYPVFLDLEGKIALVVGGGKVAQRKIETLLDHGAEVHIVSRELTPELEVLVNDGRIRFLGPDFHEGHLADAFLVIAATDDEQLNHRVSEVAGKKGLLMNAVDQPSDCNFIVPSIVRRGDLLIAISTSGKSPALAKKIRKELEIQFGREYEAFLALMGALRKKILSAGLSQAENSRLFHELVQSGILEALAENNREEVESILRHLLPRDLTLEDTLDPLWHNRGEQ